jgi:hypothetical protein
MVVALPRPGANVTFDWPSTVGGRVVDRQGHGVSGVVVLAFAGSRTSHSSVVATAASDSTGAYELRGVPRGPVEFWIEPNDAAGWIAPTKADPSCVNGVDFNYDPVKTGSVSITTQSASGSPAGATLALDHGPQVGIPAEGSYRFDGLSPGCHTLAAGVPGHRVETMSFTVAAGDLAVIELAPDMQ